jgi:hypothetical protein
MMFLQKMAVQAATVWSDIKSERRITIIYCFYALNSSREC